MLKQITLLLLLLVSIPVLVSGQQKDRRTKKTATSPVIEYEKGTLTNGRPTGIWEYYDQHGELTLRMNYDSSRIAYSRPDTSRYLLYMQNDWQEARPSRPPQYLGSRAKRTADLTKNIRYPLAALQQNQQGQVIIAYVINEQGQTQDYEVLTTPSKECAEAVWAVLKQQPEHWIPAIYQGRPARAKFFLRVTFDMIDSQAAAAYQARTKQEDQQPQAPYIDQIRVTAYGVERPQLDTSRPPSSRPGQR